MLTVCSRLCSSPTSTWKAAKEFQHIYFKINVTASLGDLAEVTLSPVLDRQGIHTYLQHQLRSEGEALNGKSARTASETIFLWVDTNLNDSILDR